MTRHRLVDDRSWCRAIDLGVWKERDSFWCKTAGKLRAFVSHSEVLCLVVCMSSQERSFFPFSKQERSTRKNFLRDSLPIYVVSVQFEGSSRRRDAVTYSSEQVDGALTNWTTEVPNQGNGMYAQFDLTRIGQLCLRLVSS